MRLVLLNKTTRCPGRPLRRVAGLACVLMALAGCASDRPSVPASLDAGDIQAIRTTRQAVLENNRIGESTNWTNPATGHLGTVTPLRTYERSADEPPCRDYQLTASVDGETEIGYATACRRSDGVWVSERWDDPADILAAARRDRLDSLHRDPRCDWPHRYPRDPWCRGSRSGVSVGVGVGL